jgi:hypothetical protein
MIMKTKYLLLIFCLLGSGLLYAQNSSLNRLFDKYENEDDVTIVNISKAMFNLIPGNFKTGNVDIKNMLPKIESLRIITTDKSSLKEKMYADFKAVIDKEKVYEELMRVKSNKTNVTFNVRKKGDMINELLMLVNEEDDFVAIQILGNFSLDDIKKLAEDAQTQ